MNVTLDGYIAAPGDDLGWSVPSDELFQWWSASRAGATGLALMGVDCGGDEFPLADRHEDRRDTGGDRVRPPLAGYAEGGVRRSARSTTRNTRLVTGDAVTEITRLKAEDGGPIDIAGATLAAAAMRAGLIDEYVLVTAPWSWWAAARRSLRPWTTG